MGKFYLILIGVILGLSWIPELHADETGTYQGTDNTGLNKKERIDNIEKFLTDFSKSMKSFETKLDDHSLHLKSLEDAVKKLRVDENKSSSKKGEEVKENSISSADFLKLKKDIEKIKDDFAEMNEVVKALKKQNTN